jgi:Zn-dependent protease
VNWDHAILVFGALIVSLTVHEAMHAWVAMLGGDLTAYRTGQVTLNPIPHIRREPFGMLALPLISLFLTNGQSCLGFAHAPYDPLWAARNPRKAALMSAAGPLGNVLLAAIAFGVLWLTGLPWSYESAEPLQRMAFVFLYINVLLALFNLLPLPPLDGAGIVRGLVPATGRLFDAIQAIPYSALAVFLLASRYLDDVLDPLLTTLLGWLPR